MEKLPGDWDLNLPGVNLPKGWRLRQDEDHIYLINPRGKAEMVWSSFGPTKEQLKSEIKNFFEGQR